MVAYEDIAQWFPLRDSILLHTREVFFVIYQEMSDNGHSLKWRAIIFKQAKCFTKNPMSNYCKYLKSLKYTYLLQENMNVWNWTF